MRWQLDNLLKKRSNAVALLETMILRIREVGADIDVIAACAASTDSLNALVARLTPQHTRVEAVMDAMAGAMESAQDIGNAISEGLNADSSDEDDLCELFSKIDMERH